MRDRIDEERLATCGESAIDLAISNVKAGGLPFSAVICVFRPIMNTHSGRT